MSDNNNVLRRAVSGGLTALLVAAGSAQAATLSFVGSTTGSPGQTLTLQIQLTDVGTLGFTSFNALDYVIRFDNVLLTNVATRGGSTPAGDASNWYRDTDGGGSSDSLLGAAGAPVADPAPNGDFSRITAGFGKTLAASITEGMILAEVDVTLSGAGVPSATAGGKLSLVSLTLDEESVDGSLPEVTISAVPLPAGGWLLLTAFAGALTRVRRRRAR